MFPHYPTPWATALEMAVAFLRQSPRSFRRDTQSFVAGLRPPLRVCGRENIPSAGPCLLTVNHYSRPGFHAWWLALAVSAAVPADVHWIITSAWTFREQPFLQPLAPPMRWLLRRIAGTYGFTAMPSMPPDPADVAARAEAVRRVLTYVKRSSQPIIGLAPEGQDSPDGALMWPPPGVGRFVIHLSDLGLNILPIGAYEADGAFCLRFGQPYRLNIRADLLAAERDRQAGEVVICNIALLLPPGLRGEFDRVEMR